MKNTQNQTRNQPDRLTGAHLQGNHLQGMHLQGQVAQAKTAAKAEEKPAEDNNVDVHINSKGEIVRKEKGSGAVYLSGAKQPIGCLGGSIEVSQIYKNLLDENIKVAESIWNPSTFRNLVKGRGSWDYKNREDTIWGFANKRKAFVNTLFVFNGEGMTAQNMGNHHFGAMALAVKTIRWSLGKEGILRKAGEAQMAAGTSKPEWQKKEKKLQYVPSPYGFGTTIEVEELVAPYGDDPEDQLWIKKGFAYYEQHYA